MKNFIIYPGIVCLFIMVVSFQASTTLKGNWIYYGDVYNGKYEPRPTDYTLKRNYSDTGFTAWVLEKDVKPERYETGNYKLKGDTCLETQTWCAQPSNLVGVTINYQYHIGHDTLFLDGTLPNGTTVNEYWKRVK